MNVVSVTRTVFAKVKCHQVGWKSKVKNIGEDDSDDEVHTLKCSVRGGEKSTPMLCKFRSSR